MAKNQNQLKKLYFLTKILSLFVGLSSSWTNLVSDLALYKEDQATHYYTITRHHNTLLPISPTLSHILRFIYLATHIFEYLNTSSYPSLTKSFLMESNTSHHYNLSNNSNIIPLQSYISLIHLTNYISHKVSIHISHTSYKLHLSQLIYTYFSYILQTHLSQSIHTY